MEAFVNKAYSKYPKLKLYICGHSLGGALANLCLAYFSLSDYPREVAACYTIGQPKVGNKQFKDALAFATPNTNYIRITNNQDCVPHLASGQHCGLNVHIDTTGRLTFDPPVWLQAIQKAKSVANSAVSLQYAGIADHSSPVYKSKIETHYVKSQFSSSTGDDAFRLCDQLLLVIDMVQEDVKSVRRYKVQFRAIIANVIKSRQLVAKIQDYLAFGVDAKSREALSTQLKGYYELLSKLKKEVLARKQKKKIGQRGEKASLKAFSQNMTKLCLSLQNACDALHNTMKGAKLEANQSEEIFSWVSVPTPEAYNSSSYDVAYSDINFADLAKKSEAKAGEKSHVSTLLEAAEVMIEEGKNEEALKVLEQIENQSTSLGSLSEEDSAHASFLKAKVHAKLHHHAEALKALENVKNSGMMNSTIMQDAAFLTLKNDSAFNAMQQSCASSSAAVPLEQLIAKLNNYEQVTLTELFDSADIDGDLFLTSDELNQLLNNVGGLEAVLDQLGWKNEKIDQPAIMAEIFQEIRTKYRNAVDLDQFMGLMAKLIG